MSESTNEYLFVGGPLDGKRKQIYGDQQLVVIAISDPATIVPDSSPFVHEYEVKCAQYRRLIFDDHGTLYTIYVSQDVRPGRIFERLIAGYCGTSETVMMPKELTAENGAKEHLIGEFHETIEVWNPDWDPDFDDENEPETITRHVHVSWTTIKAIYKRCVDLFGRTT